MSLKGVGGAHGGDALWFSALAGRTTALRPRPADDAAHPGTASWCWSRWRCVGRLAGRDSSPEGSTVRAGSGAWRGELMRLI